MSIFNPNKFKRVEGKGIIFGQCASTGIERLSLFINQDKAQIVTLLVAGFQDFAIRLRLQDLKELREGLDQAIKHLEMTKEATITAASPE